MATEAVKDAHRLLAALPGAVNAVRLEKRNIEGVEQNSNKIEHYPLEEEETKTL